MTEELIRNHINTHTVKSAEDVAAVTTLDYFLRSFGKVNTNFASNDKWPNHDGTFEFVSNPDISRSPDQVFSVQIKGTRNYREVDGHIAYSLTSLAFPAFIAKEVTADPGILFVVLNPSDRVSERVFWKYLSPSVIKNIDFSKKSTTIKLYPHEEIKNTDESINNFCNELQKIIDTHLFLDKLNKTALRYKDAIKIIQIRCEEVSEEIDRINKFSLRDKISRKIMRSLYDICYSVLVLNAYKLGYNNVNERLAWEIARLDINTKYLSDFMMGLKYIGIRIPEEGQSERLMLKYYNYLWEIRSFLKDRFNMSVLNNLESFPLDTDTLDKEYYELVANSIKKLDLTPTNSTTTRYYVQKKIPFYVDEERYYEITLQMAGIYATKFNRITVYTKLNISTSYSIQIAYSDTQINLWGIQSTIRVINNWKVSINPTCLNQLGKIVQHPCSIKRTHGEYISLMEFLTVTGMDLLGLINLDNPIFEKMIEKVYDKTNTSIFKEVLISLHNNYSVGSNKMGKYTIRYILLYLREDIFKAVCPNQYDAKYLNDEVYLSKRCYPFEKNPYISNLVGKRTSRGLSDILRITANTGRVRTVSPYWSIESLVRETGEIYIDESIISSHDEIEKYNSNLDVWEKNNGYMINKIDNFVYIESYEKNMLSILSRLLELSTISNQGQQNFNRRYIEQSNIQFQDMNKKIALEKAFVSSRVMLIYGAAGTGKTTLMNYISSMLSQEKKLFLTKTHTALQNLKRRVDNSGSTDSFECIDSFVRSNAPIDYSVIFIDECSTIDNRTMNEFFKKIDNNTFLIMAGDIYQIESIDFGNWFYYAKEIIHTDGANVELVSTWRTEDEDLKSLWDEVRKKDLIITEKLAIDGPFSEDIGKDIFSYDEGEIILCLNYDGKFGLNNMNYYFQSENPNEEVFSWAEWTFKIGDPIIFLDTKRSELLYNNLKGKIVNISKDETGITFVLDIDTILTERQCQLENFEFLDIVEDKTRIQLKVLSCEEDQLSEEDQIMTIIPFQIAYAVSIHKAQGLEYNSVKVVIPSANAEKITHSIFYTAITRAKEKLKIYWSAETMEKIIESFSNEERIDSNLYLIKNRLGLK